MGSRLETRFERYAETMIQALGHADRATPARRYLRGLMLPGSRKSVEPMAARVHPQDVRSAHQSMHHLVADSEWSDGALLTVVAHEVVPVLTAALEATVKMRWRVERDYRELKQEVGLGHYEGRNWRGFHHHASLCIAAYGFLMLERLSSVKKNTTRLKTPALPEGFLPRGSVPDAAPRPVVHRNGALSDGPRYRSKCSPLPVLRKVVCAAT